jgi:EAL domain-containing protein (putative c-di-GMP-specific phosphodiesterase class I)
MRCLVNEIAAHDGPSSIVQAVVNIANARSMTTTAEGGAIRICTRSLINQRLS